MSKTAESYINIPCVFNVAAAVVVAGMTWCYHHNDKCLSVPAADDDEAADDEHLDDDEQFGDFPFLALYGWENNHICNV
eukprot:6458115-Amphidinium_carterae.1